MQTRLRRPIRREGRKIILIDNLRNQVGRRLNPVQVKIYLPGRKPGQLVNLIGKGGAVHVMRHENPSCAPID